MYDRTAAVPRWRLWRGSGDRHVEPPSPRRRAQRTAAVVALVVAIVIYASVVALHRGYYDLKVYHGAINHWVDGGDLYGFSLGSRSGRRYGFTYPPFAALTMLPMAVVPLPAAIVVSVTATVAATAAVLHWLVTPIARDRGWDPWLALAGAGALTVAFEPVGDTLGFGQVNMLLVLLVAADLLLLGGGRRGAGVLIGLATAIKLTPGIFIVYLLVTGRWRAVAVAGATAGGGTLLAALVAPGASRGFWTDALWHPERVGVVSGVSNQSLHGLVGRLDPAEPNKILWLALVLAVLGVWVWRVRAAAAAGDEVAGFALTGAVGCLVSPFTWVHHLVWLMPAVIVLLSSGYVRPAGDRRRRWLLWFGWFSFGLLCSRLVWVFGSHYTGWGVLGSNLYVILSVALLAAVPIGLASHGGRGAPVGVPESVGLRALSRRSALRGRPALSGQRALRGRPAAQGRPAGSEPVAPPEPATGLPAATR